MYGTAGRTPQKPSWGRLYVLAMLMLGLLALVETLVPAGAWRRILEIIVTVIGWGAIHLWVRANRRALDLAGALDAGFRQHAEPPAAIDPVGSGGDTGVPPPHMTSAKPATTQVGRRGTVVALPRR